MQVECIVIGAGVVGLAVARALALAGREVVVLEAADAIGTETSSRNSEVIHAGIYYPAGSLKAHLCVSGKKLLYDYCCERDIPHRRLGKVIVAVNDAQIDVLEDYQQRAETNGVNDLQWLNRTEMASLEPAVTCVRGLLSPSTGIIDSHALMLSLQGDLENAGGMVVLRSPVARGSAKNQHFILSLNDGENTEIRCRILINAAGLQAQHVARQIRGIPLQTIPQQHLAKGHYFSLSGKSPFSRLIYPVAESGGLGVHVTLDMAGQARFGPDVMWLDNIDYQFDESRRTVFIEAIQRYYPELEAERLQPAYTGVRPKLSGPGESAADFMMQGTDIHGIDGLVNLYGIESPGLTASLAIAQQVVSLLA